MNSKKEEIFNLEKEIRCDFQVTTKRKKVWKVQIELAEEIKRICQKYRIKYFIIWGTLLGAVRHQGYIPWDDDFDIAFLRKDYEKFLVVAKREIKEPYFLQTALTDLDFFIGYARLRDSRTTGMIIDNKSLNYNNGIFIDLYPLDVIPQNIILRNVKLWCRNKVLKLCTGYWEKKKSKNKEGNSKTKESILHYKRLCVLFDKCCKFGNKSCQGNVGLVFHPVLANTYKFSKNYADQTIILKFENTCFSAPAEYTSILREVYGNYEKLPPKRKRGQWHVGQIVYEPDISYLDFIKEGRKVVDEKI